jgi:hypothetical protein
LILDRRGVEAAVRHLIVHAHAFLVLHSRAAVLLRTRHVAALADETGTVLLLLWLLASSLTEHVAILTSIVRHLLISYGLIDRVPCIALAARRYDNLVLGVDFFLLVLQKSLSRCV